MAKKVFTARQIEKKFENGERTLVLDQNVVLTDMAYEKARQLGMELVSDQMNPSPSAPIRPYLSKIRNLVDKETVQVAAPPLVTEPIVEGPPQPTEKETPEMVLRIRNAVLEKFGSPLEPAMVEMIIRRVLKHTRLK